MKLVDLDKIKIWDVTTDITYWQSEVDQKGATEVVVYASHLPEGKGSKSSIFALDKDGFVIGEILPGAAVQTTFFELEYQGTDIGAIYENPIEFRLGDNDYITSSCRLDDFDWNKLKETF